MVQYSVDHRVRQRRVAEDLAPMVEPLVASHDCAFLLVPHGYQLEQQVGIPFVDGQEPDLVDDDEAVALVIAELFGEEPLRLRLPQVRDEVAARREVRPVPAARRRHADRHGQVGLPRPRRAEEHYVSGRLDEPEPLQVQYLLLVELRLEREIVVRHRLPKGEVGDLDHRLVDPPLPGGHLLGGEGPERVDDAHRPGVYRVDGGVEAGFEFGELQRVEGIQQLDVVRAHAPAPISLNLAIVLAMYSSIFDWSPTDPDSPERRSASE